MTKTKIDGSEEYIIHRFVDYLISQLKDRRRFSGSRRLSKTEIIVFLNNRKWKFIDSEIEHREG